ncbi:MAG: shikimate dehydrogenase [Hyphomicrobiales bacterium]|nr:shikimate dehydrogenase [Hyphomicrobiales bacterium]
MTVTACVIGWPIEHSRSPLVHGYWLTKYGIDGRYTKEAVSADKLSDFVKAMAAEGYAGCNVTVPHKEAVLALADHADDTARAIGAANTLWFENGTLFATNTDTYGFMTHLDTSAPGWSDGLEAAAVLGAGGAARAVLKGLVDNGVGEIRLFNRTAARAEALAERFGSAVVPAAWETRSDALKDCGLLVNTTSLGMTGAPPLALDLGALGDGAVVADIVYAPLETALLAQARARGLRAVDGLGMLLHQAVPGFHKWFGVEPAVTDELRAVIVADLEQA